VIFREDKNISKHEDKPIDREPNKIKFQLESGVYDSMYEEELDELNVKEELHTTVLRNLFK